MNVIGVRGVFSASHGLLMAVICSTVGAGPGLMPESHPGRPQRGLEISTSFPIAELIFEEDKLVAAKAAVIAMENVRIGSIR